MRTLSDYQAVIDSIPAVEGMQIVRRATCLGMEVGPGASAAQRTSVLDDIRAMFRDISSAPSLMGRVTVFNAYVASLVGYKAQLA